MNRISEALSWNSGPQNQPSNVFDSVFENTNVWNDVFVCKVKQLLRFTYRTNFPRAIPKHELGPSPLVSNMNMVFRQLPYENLSNVASNVAAISANSFTSDAGWGCMIRTGQTLLANALARQNVPELEIVKLFADDESAMYSVHNIVDYASQKAEKFPGQWFGPSTVAGFIKQQCKEFNVYLAENNFINEANLPNFDKSVLILCGLRLSPERTINPIYHENIKLMLSLKQCVGIAGGRTSASYYFYGSVGEYLLYHDPHETYTALTTEHLDLESCHSSRIDKLHITDMDSSFLAGFLVRNSDEYMEFKHSVCQSKTSILDFGDSPDSKIEFTEDETSDGFILYDSA